MRIPVTMPKLHASYTYLKLQEFFLLISYLLRFHEYRCKSQEAKVTVEVRVVSVLEAYCNFGVMLLVPLTERHLKLLKKSLLKLQKNLRVSSGRKGGRFGISSNI